MYPFVTSRSRHIALLPFNLFHLCHSVVIAEMTFENFALDLLLCMQHLAWILLECKRIRHYGKDLSFTLIGYGTADVALAS